MEARGALAPFLRGLGTLLLIGGVIGAIYFFAFFETTVGNNTFGGDIDGRQFKGVHNIGLMGERQNGLLLSIAAAFLGGVLFCAGQFMIQQADAKLEESSSPSVALNLVPPSQLPQPKLCPHCGKYYAQEAAFCPNCGQPLNPK